MHLVRRRVSRAAVVSAVATIGLVSAALASSFTLAVAKNAKVTDQSGTVKHESIVTNSRGFAVYWLTGDSARHPECTAANGCFKFWPPVTVSSARKLSKAPGVKGKLGLWHRNGFLQVTLGGHPVYRFAFDKGRAAATGEGIRSFGGTWHVTRPAASTGGGQTGSPTPAPAPMNPMPCAYPPC
jgi:predicted lipoprotein with Yx(FWY)xxD motif